ncbi:MAG TPA: DUF1365 domain-containing protein [Patescibacteria group bacterium]|nr:DUF1365 domain-containing protein [Patescibacteria group bacterium]
MKSHLLEGRVRHRRVAPFDYGLDHAVYYAALDLAELDEVAGRLRLLSRNGRGLVAFRDDDHLPDPAVDLPTAIDALLSGSGIDPAGWQITLVTNLRVLGYVFNPASFYLCRNEAGELQVVIVEVHNTHGERHLYLLRRDPAVAPDAPFRATMAKDFYVSPFIAMDGRYAVHVRDTPDRLSIAINERHGDRPLLTTSLVLRRRALTDRSLLRMLIRHPLMTQRTIGLIHLHALRLWLKGARFHRHGAAGPKGIAGRTARRGPGAGRAIAGHGAGVAGDAIRSGEAVR